MVIQRDSFYYLKNQSADLERQVDVLRKINEYERVIDGICWGLEVRAALEAVTAGGKEAAGGQCCGLGSALLNRVPSPGTRGGTVAFKGKVG